MSKFQYLAGIIPFTFGIVFLLTVVIVGIYWWKQNSQSPERQRSTSLFQHYVTGRFYEVVYRGSLHHWIGSEWSMYLLLLWRLVCLGYFLGVTFLWNYIRAHGDNVHYFTLWNIDLIAAYYFLLVVASCIGIVNNKQFEDCKQRLPSNRHETVQDNPFWSDSLTKFGYAIQILYETTGSTAFFITVVAFGTLDPRLIFWNVNVHFMTSMSLLVEIALNRMIVRWEHVLFTIYWALMYLIFIWPVVAEGKLHDWPYFFLKTDTTAVFPWYIGLIIALIIFYYIFWGISYLKEIILERVEGKIVNTVSTEQFTTAIMNLEDGNRNSEV